MGKYSILLDEEYLISTILFAESSGTGISVLLFCLAASCVHPLLDSH